MFTGVKWNEPDPQFCSHCRTCRFDNVCVNLSSHDIQFYKGNDNIPLFYDDTGRPHHEFPTDFVDTGERFR